MALSQDDVAIRRPCPVDLPETFRGGANERHCAHCDKAVHLLSSRTESEAREFLQQHKGEDICVTYLVDDQGKILFQRERDVVPLRALSRRRIPAVAAAGLALAMAACAPHDNPRVETTPTVVVSPETKTPPTTSPQIPDEPCDTKRPDPPVMMAGAIAPEPPPVTKIEPPVTHMKAGGVRALPPPVLRRGEIAPSDI
ncbi:MAG: hypothetical protein K1X88_05455 [Nannocystaceae bacterium]|nr:hypothetical protein [Nannocystaceae bacterium]